MKRLLYALMLTCLASGSAWSQTAATPYCAPLSPSAHLPLDPGAPLYTQPYGSVVTQDGHRPLYREQGNELGLLVPDMEGNYILIPGGPRPSQDPLYVEALELKLKVRELAAQLLETWPNGSMAGMVALPTSFVSLDNFQETSPLGRYIAEALFYEFNTRGFATREYRANGLISFSPDGEHAITRNLPSLNVADPLTAIIVGTYLRDNNAVFINARMIRASDGLVLRTAQLVLPANSLVSRLTPIPHPLKGGGLRIVQGRTIP